MTALLDGNVLIALSFADHGHHRHASTWFTALGEPFATCPTTQATLLRAVLREEPGGATQAWRLLATLTASAAHEFWPDDIGYADVPAAGVRGHRQVTDAYLAQLARRHRGRVGTFDRGFAQAHPDVAELVPTS